MLSPSTLLHHAVASGTASSLKRPRYDPEDVYAAGSSFLSADDALVLTVLLDLQKQSVESFALTSPAVKTLAPAGTSAGASTGAPTVGPVAAGLTVGSGAGAFSPAIPLAARTGCTTCPVCQRQTDASKACRLPRESSRKWRFSTMTKLSRDSFLMCENCYRFVCYPPARRATMYNPATIECRTQQFLALGIEVLMSDDAAATSPVEAPAMSTPSPTTVVVAKPSPARATSKSDASAEDSDSTSASDTSTPTSVQCAVCNNLSGSPGRCYRLPRADTSKWRFNGSGQFHRDEFCICLTCYRFVCYQPQQRRKVYNAETIARRRQQFSDHGIEIVDEMFSQDDDAGSAAGQSTSPSPTTTPCLVDRLWGVPESAPLPVLTTAV